MTAANIVFLGPCGVGKTCMVIATKSALPFASPKPTEKFPQECLTIRFRGPTEGNVELNLHDTPGKAPDSLPFEALWRMDVDVFCFVCDITRAESLTALLPYIETFKEKSHSLRNAMPMLVATHRDSPPYKHEITPDELLDFATLHGLYVTQGCIVNAKSPVGVRQFLRNTCALLPGDRPQQIIVRDTKPTAPAAGPNENHSCSAPPARSCADSTTNHKQGADNTQKQPRKRNDDLCVVS